MHRNEKIAPPAWASKFLEFYCREEYLEEISGDVHELFEQRQQRSGLAKAKRLFVWDVMRFFKWSNIKRTKRSQLNSNGMIRNYLKISWRGLVRDKLYSVINLSGLAVAIAVFMLIFLYVKDELSFDRYHQDGDQIYRVVSNLTTPGNYFEFALTPPHLAERMRQDFPQIEATLRLAHFSGTVTYNNEAFEEGQSIYADSTFFDFFSIPLLEGNREEVLTNPYAVVLTESTAKRYFGDEPAIGKLLSVGNFQQPLQVTGVMADVPYHTHFDTDLVVSLSTRVAEQYIQPGQWFFLDYYTYLKMNQGTSPATFEAGIPDFIEKHIGNAQRSANQTYEFEFQLLKDIYLKSHRDVEIAVNGNIQYVYVFSVVAIFILVIACVNFMNLSTARASKRSREIGVRKVVGALRKQLISQFLIESLLISFIAFVLATTLTYVLLPSFNTLVSKVLVFEGLFSGFLPYAWLGLVLLVGLLAGIYPALFLSRLRSINVLNGTKTVSSGSSWLRKGLVVFQLMISTTLIIGVLVINKQLGSMQNRNLGFDKEQIVLIDYSSGPEIAELLRSEFTNNASVRDVSFSRFSPREGAINWFTQYEKVPGELQNASMFGALVDFDFMETYGFELVAGRGFNESIAMDHDSAYVVNEAAVKKVGYASNEAALGQLIGQNGNLGRIIGVIKDFNFQSLHNEIEPLVMYITPPQFYTYVSVKLEPGNGIEALEALEEDWNKINPESPFEAGFLDDRLNQYYDAEILTRKVFGLLSNLAIFIAALGLFALSTFIAAQQQKAMSVRKVLGASSQSILLSFLVQFVKLSLVAFAISAPIAWFLADSWLENFTYRVNVSVVMLALTACLLLLLTVITVAFQSLKISRANPASILRSE